MKGRYRFVTASGYERDVGIVRKDFQMAKVVGNVRYGKSFIFYRSVMKWIYVDYEDIVWVYRRPEDVQMKFGNETEEPEVHSLMIVTKDKKRIGMPVGDSDAAVEGLKIIRKHNTFADVGFTKEKEERYL